MPRMKAAPEYTLDEFLVVIEQDVLTHLPEIEERIAALKTQLEVYETAYNIAAAEAARRRRLGAWPFEARRGRKPKVAGTLTLKECSRTDEVAEPSSAAARTSRGGSPRRKDDQ